MLSIEMICCGRVPAYWVSDTATGRAMRYGMKVDWDTVRLTALTTAAG
jgi:hypothetical protein